MQQLPRMSKKKKAAVDLTQPEPLVKVEPLTVDLTQYEPLIKVEPLEDIQHSQDPDPFNPNNFPSPLSNLRPPMTIRSIQG